MNTRLTQFSALYSLLRNANLGREDILAFQNRQLRRLITHAYTNVPYYRRLFDQNGLKPDDIRSVADLSAIPITSKKDLQSLPAKEVVALGLDPKQLITHTTSGSSGEPFTLRHTWFEERLFELFRLRTMLYFGLRFTDRQVSIGLIRPTHPRNYQLPLKVLQALGLLRRGLINCLLPPQEIVRALRDLKPDVLTGYSGVLSRISHFPEGA